MGDHLQTIPRKVIILGIILPASAGAGFFLGTENGGAE
jgi:hypothetical protein